MADRRPRIRGRHRDVLEPGGRLALPVVARVLTRAVVLVEGLSDQAAVETLARRRGRDLEAEGVSVVPMGGAQAIGRFLAELGPSGRDLRLAGLCDEREEADFSRALERAGFGANMSRADMESAGFYVCVRDLEDELVRTLGSTVVQRIIEAEGELGPFETFRKQPEKRGLTLEEQLYGFMWNRKIRYAPLLVDALDLAHVPWPLDRVLSHV